MPEPDVSAICDQVDESSFVYEEHNEEIETTGAQELEALRKSESVLQQRIQLFKQFVTAVVPDDLPDDEYFGRIGSTRFPAAASSQQREPTNVASLRAELLSEKLENESLRKKLAEEKSAKEVETR